jgi:predicted SnoaL-like aldol condensation-catalyzing enzyme
MEMEDNKSVVRRFLHEAFDRQNPTIVDELFAPDHVIRGPKLGTGEVRGTEEIKDELHDYTGARCTIQYQIAEGDWVATSYTLHEENQEHMGVLLSRLADGKIQETFVVAREIPEVESYRMLRRAFN